jgi:hypothetical protein
MIVRPNPASGIEECIVDVEYPVFLSSDDADDSRTKEDGVAAEGLPEDVPIGTLEVGCK